MGRHRRLDLRGRAAAVLHEAAAARLGRPYEVGAVRHVGDGLFRSAYAAWVRGGDAEYDWIALLPGPENGPGENERTRVQHEVLRGLSSCVLPFDVPAPVGLVDTPDGYGLVMTSCAGAPLQRERAHTFGVDAIETTASVAAATHAIDATSFEVNERFASRRDHALRQLSALDRLCEHRIAADATAWCEDHLPPADPPVLLHGDLMGQNVLVTLAGRPCVIDWEFAEIGDPAYDLAVVTRGDASVYGTPDAVERLVDAYLAHGGQTLTVAEVRVHELCLVAGQILDRVRRSPAALESELGRLRNALARARA